VCISADPIKSDPAIVANSFDTPSHTRPALVHVQISRTLSIFMDSSQFSFPEKRGLLLVLTPHGQLSENKSEQICAGTSPNTGKHWIDHVTGRLLCFHSMLLEDLSAAFPQARQSPAQRMHHHPPCRGSSCVTNSTHPHFRTAAKLIKCLQSQVERSLQRLP
jgi:hypothetical protein